MGTTNSLTKWLGCGGMALLAQVAMAAPVGEVVFVIGQAQVKGADAPLKKGAAIEAGQIIVTGANGHVHVRFVDQGFVSVRPDSVLAVEQYAYDPAQPTNNRVKFQLQQGSSRLISGKASAAAKQNFRINTPVAAIGVRGTDFQVQTDASVTRASVQQGAIVVSPLGEGCLAEALGPCGGALARDLEGSLTGRFFEIKPNIAPELKLPEGAGDRPFGLPQPTEPKVSANGEVKFAENLKEGSPLMWGRWNGSAPAGYEMIGQLETMAIYRQSAALDLPLVGEVKFRPVEINAYARADNGALTAASIHDPELTVNFATNQYATKFVWSSGDRSYALNSTGSVSGNGRFHSSSNKSNMAISGGLTAKGEEAAYLFLKKTPGSDPYGLIHWAK